MSFFGISGEVNEGFWKRTTCSWHNRVESFFEFVYLYVFKRYFHIFFYTAREEDFKNEPKKYIDCENVGIHEKSNGIYKLFGYIAL